MRVCGADDHRCEYCAADGANRCTVRRLLPLTASERRARNSTDDRSDHRAEET
jgi:hypothetical protein